MALGKKFDFDDIHFDKETLETATKEVKENVSEASKAEESKSDPAAKQKDDYKINTNITLTPKKVNRKTIHKNFIISEELNEKFKKLAQETGYNENQLFNELLEQILK